MLKYLKHRFRLHSLLLLLWIILGTVLRFTGLSSKALWDDEFATIVFSLGHTFLKVPINQVIPLGTLLQPLQVDSSTSVHDVIHHLMTESTHPPIYFALNHWWMRWFPTSDGLVNAWVARSLSAIFGVLSIPAMYGLGWLISRSQRVAQVAAALMAVSPFGVYLAQEARHYTLAILWVIASCACLVKALERLQQRQRLPLWLGLCWVLVNSLGIATHYFFVLTLGAEALVIAGVWLLGWHTQLKQPAFKGHNPAWKGIYAVAVGTAVGCSVWLFAARGNQYGQATQWAFDVTHDYLEALYPVRRTLWGLASMFVIVPLQESDSFTRKVITVLLFCFSVWLVQRVVRGLRSFIRQAPTPWLVYGLGGVIAGVMLILCLLDFLLGARITTGLRYHFSYFPAAIALVAMGLAFQPGTSLLRFAFQRNLVQPEGLQYAKSAPSLSLTSAASTQLPAPPLSGLTSAAAGPQSWAQIGRKNWAVALVLVVGTLSALAVCTNLTFQKIYRPDLMAPDVRSLSQAQAVIGIPQPSYSKMRRLMGLGYELKQMHPAPQFYLDDQTSTTCSDDALCGTPTPAFRQALTALPRPLDLWLIDFEDMPDLSEQKCVLDTQLGDKKQPGYNYRHYRCLN